MRKKAMAILLKQMDARKRYEEWKGVRVIVKPIPEGGEPGAMDPRGYRFAKQLLVLWRVLFRNQETTNPYQHIQPYRKLFHIRKSRRHYVRGIRASCVRIPRNDGSALSGVLYRNQQADAVPLIVYYHGGGFFGGGLHVVDALCRQMAKTTGCAVLSVDYRLCPEHSYACLLEDCWSAVKWAHSQSQKFRVDADRLIVAGDSAGGTLAAAAALRDRDEHTEMIKAQILLYPVVNAPGNATEFYSGSTLNNYRIAPQHAEVLRNIIQKMTDMIAQMHDGAQLETVFLQDSIRMDSIYLAPLLDDFHDLPPTFLAFGEHDMLAAEDMAYAQRALKAGASCKTVIYEGMLHGFADQIGYFPQAEDCVQEIADWLRFVL